MSGLYAIGTCGVKPDTAGCELGGRYTILKLQYLNKDRQLVFGRLADGLVAGAESAQASVQEAFFEPVIRLGVTGPSRAGKTVFITSLVANLLNRGRMQGLQAQSQGRIQAGFLEPQPDDLVPRFEYENHLACITGQDPQWTAGTDRISELRLSLRVAPSGLLGGVRNPRKIHIDIVDYPGEWLLDLGLLDMDYASWSDGLSKKMAQRSAADEYNDLVGQFGPDIKHDEPIAASLADCFTKYLQRARDAGFFDTTPGRFMLPGDLEGSPVLTFAPIPGAKNAGRGTLGAEMARRFEAYKRKVVRPFFRNHFARIDRQIVLVDPLRALSRGPQALADLEGAMATTLGAFRPGKNSFLQTILRGRRIDKILFAATKADTLHHTQHGALATLTQALLEGAVQRAEFAGAQTKAMAIASLRTTTEEMHDGLGMVVGRVEGRERPVASYPGTLPAAPGDLIALARSGAREWDGEGFSSPRFLPRPLSVSPGDGLPHLRLDHAAEFLLGDRL